MNGSGMGGAIAALTGGEGSAIRTFSKDISDVAARELVNIAHGRFERMLSGLTAAAAVITTTEIYAEHYRASFGNKWMWSPILVTPPVVVAGIAGVFNRRWAKTVLPIASAVYAADGLVGEYFHIRGVARKPGGWKLATYNVPMGPPIAAPGLMSLVGGMGLVAAVLRREKSVLPSIGAPTRTFRRWRKRAASAPRDALRTSREALRHG